MGLPPPHHSNQLSYTDEFHSLLRKQDIYLSFIKNRPAVISRYEEACLAAIELIDQ